MLAAVIVMARSAVVVWGEGAVLLNPLQQCVSIELIMKEQLALNARVTPPLSPGHIALTGARRFFQA